LHFIGGLIRPYRKTLVIIFLAMLIETLGQIIVIDRGVVAESGSHEELMALNGVYAGLHYTQFDPDSDKVIS
jgi:ATP-binding cassette, subfamily B, bacterial MsbA